MKRGLEIGLVISLSLSMFISTGCGAGTTATSQSVSESIETKPVDLSGVWDSKNESGSYHEAIITKDTIYINIMTDNGKTSSVYWIGTYKAPTEPGSDYSWTSTQDKSKTANALFASQDDTKDITYKDGVISYKSSMMGVTTTMELTQTSKEIPNDIISEESTGQTSMETSTESLPMSSTAAASTNSVPDTASSAETESTAVTDLYKTTYEKNTFFTDSIGTIWSTAITEITNVSSQNLYLDYGSYELTSADGTVIHTSTGTYVPYPQIIAPGEKGYYFEETTMDAGTPTDNISITSRPKVSIAQNNLTRLDVAKTQIYDKQDYGTIDLHGEVTNNTGSECENVYVAAILYNSSNEPVTLLINILTDKVAPGGTSSFELEPMALPDDFSTGDVANYQVYAYPQQFQFG